MPTKPRPTARTRRAALVQQHREQLSHAQDRLISAYNRLPASRDEMIAEALKLLEITAETLSAHDRRYLEEIATTKIDALARILIPGAIEHPAQAAKRKWSFEIGIIIGAALGMNGLRPELDAFAEEQTKTAARMQGLQEQRSKDDARKLENRRQVWRRILRECGGKVTAAIAQASKAWGISESAVKKYRSDHKIR